MNKWLILNWTTYKITGQIPAVFAVIIPYHLFAIAGIAFSAMSWSWYYLIFFVLGYCVFGGIGDAIMLHRYSSHRSFVMRNGLKTCLLWIACLTGQGSPIWWAALHRGYHHAHSDKEKDIHSPIKGKWHSYMGWMLVVTHDTVNLKYATDLLRDKKFVWFHKNYNKILWATLAVIGVINPMFCLWFIIIPSVFALHTENLVNTLCHLPSRGYKRFATSDNSQNIWYLGFFGWGQGWHNNHHHKPTSFDFGTTVSKKWWEFDPCLLILPLVAPLKETRRILMNRKAR